MRGLLVVIALSGACASGRAGAAGLVAGAGLTAIGYAVATSADYEPNGAPSDAQRAGATGVGIGILTMIVSFVILLNASEDDDQR